MNNKKYFKNILLTLNRIIIGTIIGLLISIIIARSLGPENQGIFSLILLLPTILVTFTNFGVGVSTVYLMQKSKYKLFDVIKTNYIISIFLSIFTIIIGFTVIYLSDELFFSTVDLSLLLIALIAVPPLLNNQFIQTVFQGLEDFKTFNIVLVVGQSINLVIILLLSIINSLTILTSLIAYICSNIGITFILFYMIKKKLKFNYKEGTFDKKYLQESIEYGVKSHLSNILAFLNYRVDMLIIAFLLNPIQVGYYTIAVNITERIWFLSQAVSTVLFPRISKMSDEEAKVQLTTFTIKIMLLTSIIMGVILLFLSDIFVNILFGSEYQMSAIILVYLIPGIVFGSISRLIANDFAGRGKPEYNLYTSIFTLISNIVLNFILIPIFGVIGAALATSITYLINLILKCILYRRLTKVSYKNLLLLNIADINHIKIFFKIFKKQ